MDEIALLNKINSSNQISEANLQELPDFSPNFKNHKKGLEFIHFKNSSLQITPGSIERVKHEDIPNYILGKLDINDTTLKHYIDRKVFNIKQPLVEITATKKYQELLDKKRMPKPIPIEKTSILSWHKSAILISTRLRSTITILYLSVS